MVMMPLRPSPFVRSIDSGSEAGNPPASAAAAQSFSLWRTGRRAAHSDAWRVLFAVLATFVAASAFQWQERVSTALAGLERWQVDELPSTLTALALGLAWYAARRRSESARLLAHNRQLAQRLIGLQDDERLLLARELHDEFAQHCTAIRFEAAYLRRSADPAEVAAAARRAADAAEQLQQAVRRMLRRLRPPELDELGLVGALEALCGAWERRSGVSCEWRAEGRFDALGEKVATGIYRIAQEACENALRHAGASRVRVVLTATGSALVLQVDDDGRGFDATAPTAGLGLLGAAERASALGGRLEVDSAPGAGCRLRLSLQTGDALQAPPS